MNIKPTLCKRSNTQSSLFIAGAMLLLIGACTPDNTETTGTTETTETSLSAGEAFTQRLASHCGQAFEGRVITNLPAQENDAFADQRLVMHVRECHDDVLYVPFHVGSDRSRTWILTHTEDGLELKHDHRHEDGSDDTITMYGGTSTTAGTEVRQEFPVGASSIQLFEDNGLYASTSNVWAMEIEPGSRFLYELSRTAEERLFQVEFDLTQPVDPPPAPWGW